jgi:hypothetical protein
MLHNKLRAKQASTSAQSSLVVRQRKKKKNTILRNRPKKSQPSNQFGISKKLTIAHNFVTGLALNVARNAHNR